MVPHTLFIGQQLYFLQVCESTNTEAQQLVIKNEATEGCAVVTAHQTKGRGQRGNTWEAEPGKSITLSVVLSPTFLTAREQFSLNMAVSLAVLDLLHAQGLTEAQVKWPNDLFFQNKKLGGILIENTICGHTLQHSIVGIGLNVNQQHFGYTTATSVQQVLGHEQEVEKLTVRLLELLEKRYLQLRNRQQDKIRHEYLQALYRYQEVHLYEVAGQYVAGQMVGVDQAGRLALQVDKELRYFNFQEIKYVI
ncbi:biotin--[acetyl-CoA-carboxylase] ligase [Pontibacter sp. CAU 1760]